MKNKGFTLIEMVIYIALFSIIMGGVVVTVFQLSQSGGATTSKIIIQEEINFVLKKFDWVLTGADSGSIDTGTPGELTLNNTSISPQPIVIRFSADDIEIEMDGDTYLLATENVEVEDLEFTYDADTKIFTAEFIISGITANFSKYLKI